MRLSEYVTQRRVLKSSAAFISLLVLFTVAVHAQESPVPQVVSARIGPEIDTDEREYFGLLLHVKDFRKAVIISGPERNYTIVINDGAHSSQFITPAQLAELKRYIEGYESYRDSASADGLAMLSSVARPRLPSSSQMRLVEVTLRDGSDIEGYLLHADSVALVLSSNKDVEALTRPEKSAIHSMADVLAIRDRPGFLRRLKGELNVVLLGGSQRSSVIARIMEAAYTGGARSPEFGAYLDGFGLNPTISAADETYSLRKLVNGRNLRRMHFSLSTSLMAPEREIGMYRLGYGNLGVRDGGQVTFGGQSFRGAFSYSLTSRTRVGAELSVAPGAPETGTSTERVFADARSDLTKALASFVRDKGRVQVTGWHVNPMLMYVLHRSNALAWASGTTKYPFEVSLGAGPAIANLKTSTTLVTASQRVSNSIDVYRATLSNRSWNLGAAGQGSVDFCFSRTFSFGIVFDLQYYPRLTGEAQSATFPDITSYDEIVITRERFRNTALSFGMSLATRVHL